ncbi:hypothetical protein [Pseudonocardia kunmingensis]|uniref:Uncharacterized protein n=1 Tax=Pseudonocardia kunmingensis TaxID=630975 RepID=A0A543CYQ5_9PSEU|nr:hypothetical protein [Pseudonocardia kunmingensis]TQM02232.1 hypothetical protein FB558_8098 [Pseudonocardia kunmingensis]
MSGVYGYPQFDPPGPQVPRLVATALLAVAAALALGGSFAAFHVYHYESDYTAPTTSTTTGWGITVEPAPEEPPTSSGSLHGVPLTVAAVLALAAAVVLFLSSRRDPGTGRSFGVGVGGLLVGVVAVIWMDLLTSLRDVRAAVAQAGPDSGFRATAGVGAGGYLILLAGLLALAAAVLLLVSRRPASAPRGGPFPMGGPGPQPPWPPQAPPWTPPGPGAPPPWGPPPPHHG